MTLVDELFDVLATIFGGGMPIVAGRVVDQIGAPISGATVRAVRIGVFNGTEVAQTTTSANGGFALQGMFPPEYLVIVGMEGTERHLLDTRQPPVDLGELRLPLPLRLTASVGDGGENRPLDVRRVQDRLHRLGRLTEADVAAEPVNLAAPPPVTPGPLLLAALATHLAAWFGRRLPATLVRRSEPTAAALTDDPPFPLSHLGLATPVGILPGADAAVVLNAPASFVVVQERLFQLGLLTRAEHVAEETDLAAIPPIDPATKPRTVAAIAAFDRKVAGGSLRAFVPGARNERLLNDPYLFGRQALSLHASVGSDGVNRPSDVRVVQGRLRELGHLSDADHATERAALDAAEAGETRIADADIPQTIAAIELLRTARLGETAPVAGTIDPVDDSLQRLNRPLRLELTDTVGWAPAIAAANRPPDVRRLQDRLLVLGFLSQADYNTEKADPYATARVDQADVVETAGALALASVQRAPLALTGAIGPGAPNACADLRGLQDRLHGLLFLAPADYQRERVDPAAAGAVAEASLASTFAAITALRQHIFDLPPSTAGEPWTALPIVEPNDETHRFLIDPLLFGRQPVRVAGSVGTNGWNFPTDVRAVQERLLEMRLLTPADYAAELADPLLPGRIANIQLSATRQAIRRLRASLLGETSPVCDRVEVRSRALVALDDRLAKHRVDIELGKSVGWDGINVPADVHVVQDRLHGLGFLAADDYELESAATPPTGEARLHDTQISETITAIGRWQELMLVAPPLPRVDPFSETLRTLVWPVIPRRVDITLGGSVGLGGGNARADVRVVQDRLFELGFLDAAAYFRDRVDPALGGVAPAATLATTRAAIQRLQETLAGLAARAPDLLVSATGRAQRILEDPSFSTPTAPNDNCVLVSAGPERPNFADADLMKIILSIELEEGGVSSGEIPAILRNASGTATSWGAAQVIGKTAIRTLAAGANAAFALFYGLDAVRLAVLVARASAAEARFNQVTNVVAAANLAVAPLSLTDLQLTGELQQYVTANVAAVRADTGLGPEDIEHMFRAAQLQQHLVAHAAVGGAAATLFNAAHADQADNIAKLRLSVSEIGTYLNNPAFYGEHGQGFVTRSLLFSPEGQIMRNALTDDSGFKIGRYVIRDNWNTTTGHGLTVRQRAQVTAYLHNHGGSAASLAGQMATVAADGYVGRVISRFDAMP